MVPSAVSTARFTRAAPDAAAGAIAGKASAVRESAAANTADASSGTPSRASKDADSLSIRSKRDVTSTFSKSVTAAVPRLEFSRTEAAADATREVSRDTACGAGKKTETGDSAGAAACGAGAAAGAAGAGTGAGVGRAAAFASTSAFVTRPPTPVP